MRRSTAARAPQIAARLGPLLAAALLAACTRRAGDTAPAGIHFAIEAAAADSIFVMVNGSDDQPGWVTVTGPYGRVYLRERCDIPDCGADPVVCGAAIPAVRRLGRDGPARRIELSWDGTTSAVDSAGRCERRHPAEPGEYRARLCYARATEPVPAGAGPMTTTRLAGPVCVERAFTLADGSVVLTL